MKTNLKIIIGIVFSIITFFYSSSISASQIDTTNIRNILLVNKIQLDYNDYTLAQQQLGADKAIFMFPKKGIVENKQIITINARLKQVSYKSIDFNDEQLKDLSINDISSLGASSILINTNNGEFIYNTITNTVVKKEKIVDYSKEGLSITDTIVIILYFLILLFIGIFFSKRQKNSDDYFKGGSRIPWWAAGLSLFGTALSAITFMAIPAKSYSTDWSYMLFNVGIVLVAPIIMFIFIPFFRKLNITTAYQYLEIRFNSIIRVICSLAFIIFQVGRMGVVLFLPAIAINIVTGFNIFLCIGLMGIFSILYTRMGGIEAVVWTDALQVVILLGGALFAIIHIVANIPGGLSETYNLAISYNKLNLGDISFDITNPTVWTVLIATCFTNLTMYGTDQSMVQRYLTTSSKKAAQKVY
jgi:Na+/proline symporter